MTDESISNDELAGIVGMFGALTRSELKRAVTELTFKQTGERPGDQQIATMIKDALETWHLVTYETGESRFLLPGPAAFPTLPPLAEDLHMMLEIEARDIERTEIAEMLLDDLENAHAEGISMDTLTQLSYDIEAWADIDASSLRDE